MWLERSILARQRLLEDIKDSVLISFGRRLEAKLQLRDQRSALDSLGGKSESTHIQL